MSFSTRTSAGVSALSVACAASSNFGVPPVEFLVLPRVLSVVAGLASRDAQGVASATSDALSRLADAIVDELRCEGRG